MPTVLLCLASLLVGADAFSAGSRSSTAPTRGGRVTKPIANLMDALLGKNQFGEPVVMGTEEMMSEKEYGTSAVPIQKDLRWKCDVETADRICNYNRHYAEYGGYWERATSFLQEESEASGEIEFYDSNTGKLLFTGPKGRSWDEFVIESRQHGWPSFRDNEVNWDYVRVLPNGECISVDGTHCINLVSVAGRPLD